MSDKVEDNVVAMETHRKNGELSLAEENDALKRQIEELKEENDILIARLEEDEKEEEKSVRKHFWSS